MLEAKVVEIGPEAVSPGDPLLILFDETASQQLRRVSIVQRFISANDNGFHLQAGDQLLIDDQGYQVIHVGKLVENNMDAIGHATLFFEPVPKQPQHNGIYLTPYQLPQIKVGSLIRYVPQTH
ncbi:PTS glucitol/sorbitol transporter subunit IIA [Liquorilactobacillus sicerae]|uniref:PTS glucitol/sorbitol transporter subunit IIA n=1 Tax=Liquorilactobacillus sicerae TaxID=1416943 RepID=UPI0024809CAB|nr:PTS glucitol/sorbitol transporter subunit IIA [Liquorilactobacillus sicerae]